MERFEYVERVARKLFCHVLPIRSPEDPVVPTTDAAYQAVASRCFDAANVFWDERERRRGEFEVRAAAENPDRAFADHRFEPSQGDPSFCLSCGRRPEAHAAGGRAWKT